MGKNIDLSCDITIDALPAHIYWKDKEGVYLGCNQRQANSLGFKSPQEIIGKTDFDLPCSEASSNACVENDKEVIETGMPKIVEEPTLVDGKEGIVLSHKRPLKDSEGNIIGVLGVSIAFPEEAAQ